MNAFAMKSDSEDNSHVYGDVSLPKQTRKRQKLLIMITDIVLDYAKNSTLHGLRYVAEKGLTTIEKLFWIATFTGSVVICLFLIKNVYVKWRTSPVIVTVSERLVSVGEIPFPSVTICPQIKSKATVYNFSQELDKILKNKNETSKQDINKWSDTSIICGVHMQFIGDRLFTNESIIETIDVVSPGLHDNIIACRGHNVIESHCTDLFKKVYTAEGLCYNMNGLASNEMFRDTVQAKYKYSERNIPTKGWSLRDGYTGMVKQPFPLHGSENIASPDLEIILRNRGDDSDGLCNGMNSGFKIYIQHPTDHPQSSLYYYAALDGEVSSMAISADVLSSLSSLEDYPAETRQCYFQKDRTLRYFKIYSASNCRAECISNYTYKECGCVGFYMPHDNSSQICAERNLLCMTNAQKVLAETEHQIRIDKSGDGCMCLAACNSIEYSAEIIRTEFHVKRYAEKLMAAYNKSFDDFYGNSSKFSKIELYFKKPQFVSMRRSELFGLTDFLANIGGLLGVFLGFSFLSLIEIFYFISLRLGCSLKRDLKEEKVRTNSLNIANDGKPISIIIK